MKKLHSRIVGYSDRLISQTAASFSSKQDPSIQDDSKQETKEDINQQIQRENLFRFFMYLNATAFIIVMFAASGLAVHALVEIVLWVYLALIAVFVINALPLLKIWINQHEWLHNCYLALSYLVYDCSLAFIALVNSKTSESVATDTAILIVIMGSLISIAILPRSLIEFIIGKIILFFAIVITLFSEEHHGLSLIFPVLLAFVLISVLTYWIYLMRLRVTEQQLGLRLLLEKLRKETDLRERLMVYIGHDLRQPINALGMLLHAMPDKDKNILEAMECVRASKRLISDIVQVADYQKPLTRDDQPFKIQTLFDAIKLEYAFVASQSRCEIRFVSTSVSVINDMNLVGRILRNFVANAIAHSSASKILIGVRRRKGSIELNVIDNGIGISENKKDSIFDDFVRAERATYSAGLGLGLSIAKHYAVICDAKILFETTPERGTSFSLRLPIKNANSN